MLSHICSHIRVVFTKSPHWLSEKCHDNLYPHTSGTIFIMFTKAFNFESDMVVGELWMYWKYDDKI